MKDYKRLSIILGIICVGCAFLFFVLGMMFATYNIMQVVSSVKIEKVNIDLNETDIVNAIMSQPSVQNLYNISGTKNINNSVVH